MAKSKEKKPGYGKHILATLLFAVLAGFCIGLGGTVFLRIKDAFPGGNVAGALLFTIGLFVICTRGYNLFTGKVCYLFDNKPSYIIDLIIIWIGNLLGSMLIAGLETLTGIAGGDSGVTAIAQTLVAGKMGSSLLSLFVLGIICDVFIFIAVNGYAKQPHALGKFLSLFLGVAVFILCGTEHSVADMYYWCISGVFYQNFGPSIGRILIITCGNAVGGVFFPLMEKAVAKLTAA